MSSETDYGPGQNRDPHPEYIKEDDLQDILGTPSAISSHLAEGDPHPQYDLESNVTTEIASHNSDTTAVHGVTDTSSLETQTGAQGKVDTHDGAVNAHGITGIGGLESTTGSQAKVDTHAADTTSVHGVTDTTALLTTSGVTSAITTHSGASDPHADRTFTTSAVTTHTGASDPHGDRSFSTSGISTHAGAGDPHGDRAYADAIASGLEVKDHVRAATTANITLSGTQTIDGVAVVAGNRVLVKNQTAGENNGIYDAASGSWTRSTDADTSGEVTTGMFTFVTEGTVSANVGYILNTPAVITLGTTALSFVQFSAAGQVTAGGGLTKTGSQIDVIGDSSITVAADQISVASNHGGSTHAATQAAAEATAAAAATTHAAAADPHTGYQKETERAAASGYASLDGGTKIPIAQVPTGTSSSTVAFGDAVSTHAAQSDPHTPYIKKSIGTTLGDLIAFTASATPVRHAAGANDTVLIADNTAPHGVKWGTVPNTGTGAVFKSLADYGADPTGVSSSRAALQAAIDDCDPNGDVLYIPAGNYLIDYPGVVSTANAAFTVLGPGFGWGGGSGSALGGATLISAAHAGGYVMWTHEGAGAANHQGITFENVKFVENTAAQKTLNAPGASPAGGVYAAGVITYKTTTTHGFVTGDKVWVRNAMKGYNGRFVVASAPTTTTFTVASAYDPGTYAVPPIYTSPPWVAGFVLKEPSITGIRILGETRWKVSRCSFNSLRYGLLIDSQDSLDSSWGHSDDNAFDGCDVGVFLFNTGSGGNFSTNITGGNCKLGDDQVGYWIMSGAHQKISNMKIDTSMPSGAGSSIVGDRTIGILYDKPDSASISQVDYEMESDSRCVVMGTGTYVPSWAGATGTSWTRSSAGTVNTIAGTASSYTGSISQLGCQHNDSNDGMGIQLLGGGKVDITDCQFHGWGFATCIEIGGSCSGCTIKGGRDQISNSSHKGVVIKATAKNTDIISFNRTNGGTAANHISDAGTRTNLVAVHKTETSVASYTQA